MSNLKIVSDNVEPPEPFAVAMAEWMSARAACALNEATDVGEDQVAASADALKAAEWKLLQTPAPTLCEIRQRAQVVQEMIHTAECDGRPTDNRHHLMLSALVSEIQRYTG